MAEYIDQQAEESDDDNDSVDSIDYIPKTKKTKRKKRVMHSDDDDDEDEDDEEADDAAIKKEMAGFVVEEEDEEEEAKSDKSDDKDDDEEELGEIDEEDEDLLRDNLGIGTRKPGGRVEISDDDDDEDDRDRIQRNLFDQDEVGEAETATYAPAAVGHEVDRSSESDRSDDDGFIENDDEERSRRHGRSRRPHGITEHALEEAKEIFGGDDFNFDEFYRDDDGELGDEDDEYPEDEAGDDGEEGGVGRVRRVRPKEKKGTLLDQMEPSELDRGFFSEIDQRIQLEDRPERFQLRRIPVTEADDFELDTESAWIYINAFCQQPISIQDDIETQNAKKPPTETKAKIREALKFMRNQLFEVPFIAFYRKEYVEPELGINDLWKIYQWDEKWCLLQQRIQKLADLMKRMREYQFSHVNSEMDQSVLDDLRIVSDADIESVLRINTMEEYADVLAQFQMYYGANIPGMIRWEKNRTLSNETGGSDQQGFRQAPRNDAYLQCVQSGLSSIASKFGLTPAQFADNLDKEYRSHDPEQYPVDPIETAQDYVCRAFNSPEAVLAGARYMVAKQLSRHPYVRRKLREKYRDRAVVSVRPTKKGRSEIDENHSIYKSKYIKNKPIRDLEKDEYLRLVQAQSAGLITLTLSADGNSDTTLIEAIGRMQLYHRDEYSSHVEKWNKLRADAVAECMQKFLYPLFEKELHETLLQEARDFVIRECCLRLYGYLKIGPYEVESHDPEQDVGEGVRVLGIAYPIERDHASFCALVDGDGEVVDHIRLVHLTKRKNSTRNDEGRLKNNDLEELKRFVVRRRPHVIAIAGESLDALYIKADIETALTELLDSGEISQRINVEIIDNELAKVYMNSRRAQTTDFPDYPALLREAVSLARRLQDPLPEFCQMCSADDEILCISYHPLQDCVNKDELLAALTLEFINRVNEVGVDMNRCLEHAHTLPMLQFVCGLGPRKAAQLIKVLKQNDNLLESRTKLVTLCRMGPKVFMNCAGFIKIDTAKVTEKTDSYVEVLDGSRVHPETYEWARKMAVDALEIDDTADPTSALEEILEAPERLKDLDLDAFAEELQRQGFGNKSITLYDIRAELNHRYKDLRSPYTTPSREDIFNMLTKETPQTFNVGKLVMGKVMHIVTRRPKDDYQQNAPQEDKSTGLWSCSICHRKDFTRLTEVWSHFDNQQCPGQAIGIKVRLENGITGFIPIRYISDKVDFVNPNERVQVYGILTHENVLNALVVQPNQPIYCRVLKVDTDRFQAELSCRSSDLLDKESQFRPPKDRYYDYDIEAADKKEDEAARNADSRKICYVRRVIAHPSFHNITYKDAERMLQNFDQGEAIIRPSSKGADHLTVTWKVADNIYQHIDVQEQGKEKAFNLGKSLWIGSDQFEDLDEIIARHIQPMAANAREILSHKYYVDAVEATRTSRDYIDRYLLDEKNRNQSRIPYTLVACAQAPGKFMLSYMPRVKAIHEFITVTPDGFRFRQQVFPSLNALFKWFKEHFRKQTGFV